MFDLVKFSFRRNSNQLKDTRKTQYFFYLLGFLEGSGLASEQDALKEFPLSKYDKLGFDAIYNFQFTL